MKRVGIYTSFALHAFILEEARGKKKLIIFLTKTGSNFTKNSTYIPFKSTMVVQLTILNTMVVQLTIWNTMSFHRKYYLYSTLFV